VSLLDEKCNQTLSKYKITSINLCLVKAGLATVDPR